MAEAQSELKGLKIDHEELNGKYEMAIESLVRANRVIDRLKVTVVAPVIIVEAPPKQEIKVSYNYEEVIQG